MKKIIGLFLISLLVGCAQPVVGVPEIVPPEEVVVHPVVSSEALTPPATAPETLEPAIPETDLAALAAAVADSLPEELSLADYFPVLTDSIRWYAGQGIEYATFFVRTDYTSDNQVQFHINNGATEVVNVYHISQDEVRLVFNQAETYHRLNRLGETTPQSERIVLQAPLEVGHSWDDPVLGQSTITRLDEPVVILGDITVSALVVESETVTHYYAPGYGLVKMSYPEHDIHSVLDRMVFDAAYAEPIDMIHLDESGRPIATAANFMIRTNQDLATHLSAALRRDYPEGLGLPDGFVIQQLELTTDSGDLSVDISPGIFDWPVESEDEARMLHELKLTLQGYFGAARVYLSVDQRDYVSGNLQLDKTIPLE